MESPGYGLSGWLGDTRGPFITLESQRHTGGPSGLCSPVCFQGPIAKGPPCPPFESTTGISTSRGWSCLLPFIPSICQLTTRHFMEHLLCAPITEHRPSFQCTTANLNLTDASSKTLLKKAGERRHLLPHPDLLALTGVTRGSRGLAWPWPPGTAAAGKGRRSGRGGHLPGEPLLQLPQALPGGRHRH